MDADAVAGWESSATIRILRATPECYFCSLSDHIVRFSTGSLPGLLAIRPPVNV